MIKIKKTTGHYLSDILTSIVTQFQVESYLEIGVNDGRSLKHLVSNNSNLKKLYLADNWGGQSGGRSWGNNDHIEKLLRDLDYSGETVYLDGDSQKTIPQYIENNPDFQVDLANIDGDHRQEPARQDLQSVIPITKMIVFDDIHHISHKYLNSVWDIELAKIRIQWSQKYNEDNGAAFAMIKQLDKVIQ